MSANQVPVGDSEQNGTHNVEEMSRYVQETREVVDRLVHGQLRFKQLHIGVEQVPVENKPRIGFGGHARLASRVRQQTFWLRISAIEASQPPSR